MKGTEFLQEFNVLYNNIDSNAVPGFELFEISVLLTKAQEEVAKNYLNPAGNKYKQGYDGSPKRQIDFSRLNSVAFLGETPEVQKFDERSLQYELPQDILTILNEQLVFTNSTVKKVRQVIPLSYDDYTRLMSKPFGEPMRNQAWRLVGTPSASSNTVEVIPNINDRNLTGYSKSYIIRYVRKPKPILLGDFSQTGQSIDGYNGSEEGYDLENPCEMDPEIHREIVQRAVELAKAGYVSDQTTIQTQMGSRSE